VQGDLLDIERQEAELIFSAQSQNLPIGHPTKPAKSKIRS
jgi:hypothetical protein